MKVMFSAISATRFAMRAPMTSYAEGLLDLTAGAADFACDLRRAVACLCTSVLEGMIDVGDVEETFG